MAIDGTGLLARAADVAGALAAIPRGGRRCWEQSACVLRGADATACGRCAVYRAHVEAVPAEIPLAIRRRPASALSAG